MNLAICAAGEPTRYQTNRLDEEIKGSKHTQSHHGHGHPPRFTCVRHLDVILGSIANHLSYQSQHCHHSTACLRHVSISVSKKIWLQRNPFHFRPSVSPGIANAICRPTNHPCPKYTLLNTPGAQLQILKCVEEPVETSITTTNTTRYNSQAHINASPLPIYLRHRTSNHGFPRRLHPHGNMYM